jgi:tetratricopeptide (TPR) repeat protein
MNRSKTCLLLLALSISILATASLINPTSAHRQNQQSKTNAREDAYRANNIGVALLEQFKHKEAADAFRRALQLEPTLALARINLGIALFNLPDLPAAQKELQAASTAAPSAPQPHYLLGLLGKTQNRPEEAISSFQKVLRIDANDVGANVNLGQLYAQQRKYPEAIAVLRTGLAAEPYNATALYNLGTSLMRAGQREEGQKVIAQFQELRQRGTGTTLGTNYLEQGRYAEAIASTGAEPELVDKRTPEVVFTDVTATLLAAGDWPANSETGAETGGAAVLFDFDVDGDLDLLEASGTRQRLMRNDGGKFTDITDKAGALAKAATATATAAVSGDYDNDSRPDLFVLRSGTSTLYHNDGNGSFSDVTTAAKIPASPANARSTAFADVDHDGDLDVLIAGDGHLLLRNNGDRTFTDQTTAAKLSDKVSAHAIVPTDFDNRRDIDLLIASTEKISLWRNMRDGTFRDVATDVGLTAQESKGATSVAAGDVNKDGFTDFYFSNNQAGYFAVSNGKERFQITQAPVNSDAAQFIDYDNDGLLDLVSSVKTELRILRNTGDAWADVSSNATKGIAVSRSRVLMSGDIDSDGDTDIIFGTPGGGLKVARNDGGNSNRSLRVGLAGKVSNRSGVGAKIEMRAGSLAQKLETYSAAPAPAPADVLFGLGKRTAVDAVRVLWPAGIVQAETEIANTKSPITVSLTELDRKPSSCPYLYVWNGERFEFVTDFMGGGEMGHLDAPGIYNTPDPDEYVRIRGDQLHERNGRYELRVTNELEEAVFLDRLQLIAVAHPKGVEAYPNEGLTVPPQPFKIYTTQNARAPVAAVDEHGHDVLSRIARMDREYPDDFRLQQIRGYADEHELTLKLDPDLPARALLLLTGWTDYAWSSDNLAAFQSGRSLRLPALQVKDKRGRWKTVIENVGVPVGRPQTIVVDLTGKFLSASRDVRIVTNMRIYWDQILVDTSGGKSSVQLTRLDPSIADLRWRGFSLEHSADGRQPLSYDYKKVSFTSPWKVMTGRYTREGDVRELLLETDDMFVISRPGDELVLSFAADKLPPLPQGWTRTFLLYADGFSKEMDINSASPDQVGPLPFHGMTKYPYEWPERYPLTDKRQEYLEKYNTRIVTSQVDRIAGFSGFALY